MTLRYKAIDLQSKQSSELVEIFPDGSVEIEWKNASKMKYQPEHNHPGRRWIENELSRILGF